MQLILFVWWHKGQIEELRAQLCSCGCRLFLYPCAHQAVAGWNPANHDWDTWQSAAVVMASKSRHRASAVTPRSPALSSWLWHGHYTLRCFVSYQQFCFINTLKLDLNIDFFFFYFAPPPPGGFIYLCIYLDLFLCMCFLLLLVLLLFLFFSSKNVKMSASNLGWFSLKQNISVLSAGTRRSVSDHFWQHIKLHFYLSLKLAYPFPFSRKQHAFLHLKPR